VYQSIDDPQEQLAISKPKRNKLIWVAALLALIAIIAIVYFTSPGVAVQQVDDEFIRAEQSTYRKAVSENQASLRRARLQDFLTTYPNSKRINAVQAQLDVINAHEERQWKIVSDIVYGSNINTSEKLTALNTYTAKWDASLLGGRSREIQTMKNSLEGKTETKTTPDRKLKDQQSPIPDTIPDKELAGGPKPTSDTPVTVFIPPVPIDLPKRVAIAIIPPKVKRNVNPRYPRRAMRANIEAVVTLKLNIDATGKVAMTELVNVEARKYRKSFIKAAERAALRTRFHPKTVGGKPEAAVGVLKRYRFQLGN